MTDRATRRRRIAENGKFTRWLVSGRHKPMAADDVRIAGNPLPWPAHLRMPINRNPLGPYEKPRA